VDPFGQRLADPVDLHQVLDARPGHALGRAEGVQQGLLAAGPDALDLVERVLLQVHRAPRAVGADREAVGLVAQALQVVEHRRLGLEHERRLVRHEEPLQPGVAVRALGHAHHGDVVDAQVGHHLQRRVQLALAAVDQHQVGAVVAVALFLFLDQAGEAAAQHLLHHPVVVAGRQLGRADVELAVLALHEALRPGHDHAAHRVGALDVAVVVDLDPLGRASRPNASQTPASSLVWAEPSAIFRPRASRALVRAWPTRSAFSPRWGWLISTLRPLFRQKASASSSRSAGSRLVRIRRGIGLSS
jgi:hypothetical protein